MNVTITETAWPNDPWKITIDPVGNGPKEDLKIRYTRESSAKRGAVRHLKGKQGFLRFGSMRLPVMRWWTPDGREIVFTIKRRKK